MWRSLLFIPVLEDRFIAKAAERGADAIILDLEAGVADDRKVEAREVLGSVVARLSPEVTTTVRINAGWDAASLDLDAAVIPGVSALHLALCEDPDHVRKVADRVSQLETERGIVPGTIEADRDAGVAGRPSSCARDCDRITAHGRPDARHGRLRHGDGRHAECGPSSPGLLPDHARQRAPPASRRWPCRHPWRISVMPRRWKAPPDGPAGSGLWAAMPCIRCRWKS